MIICGRWILWILFVKTAEYTHNILRIYQVICMTRMEGLTWEEEKGVEFEYSQQEWCKRRGSYYFCAVVLPPR